MIGVPVIVVPVIVVPVIVVPVIVMPVITVLIVVVIVVVDFHGGNAVRYVGVVDKAVRFLSVNLYLHWRTRLTL